MTINPVLSKEVRSRMRRLRTYVILTGYVAILTSFAIIIDEVMRASAQNDPSLTPSQIGQTLFGFLMFIQLIMVGLMAPSFTAGAITGERDRQTFDILLTTALPTPSIVLGKLMSSAAFVILLIFAAIPVASIVFLLGGVGPQDLYRGLAVLLATALLFGSIGIFFTSAVRNTIASITLTYGSIVALTVGTLLLYALVAFIGTIQNGASPSDSLLVIFWPNAVAAMVSVVSQTTTSSPFDSGWLGFVGFSLVLSVILLSLAIRLVRPALGRPPRQIGADASPQPAAPEPIDAPRSAALGAETNQPTSELARTSSDAGG